MPRAAIIENEVNAQRLLSKIIEEYCPNITLVGVAATIIDAKKLLESEKPELVFLDIQLDDGDGFELLDVLENQSPKIIFTTAYDNHAIRAIKYDAVDYLLKPISPQEVIRAVQKVTSTTNGISNEDFRLLIEQLTAPVQHTLNLHTAEGVSILNIDNIVRIEADGSYSYIYMQDGSKEMVSKSIGTLENQINHKSFIRVHTSHIIHTQYLRKYIKEDGGYALMRDGTQVPVSRRRKAVLLEGLG